MTQTEKEGTRACKPHKLVSQRTEKSTGDSESRSVQLSYMLGRLDALVLGVLSSRGRSRHD
jgi:hypothetical protein